MLIEPDWHANSPYGNLLYLCGFCLVAELSEPEPHTLGTDSLSCANLTNERHMRRVRIYRLFFGDDLLYLFQKRVSPIWDDSETCNVCSVSKSISITLERFCSKFEKANLVTVLNTFTNGADLSWEAAEPTV